MKTRMTVGRCCCDKCTILNDEFTRSDSSDLGSDWEERSGDWAISSNALAVSNADSVVITTATYSTSAHISVRLDHSTSASKRARVIVDYQDDDNYHFAEVVSGTDAAKTLRLWVRSAGTETALAAAVSPPAGTGNTVYLSVCFVDGRFTASGLLGGAAGWVTHAEVTPFGGDKVGLALKDATSVTWDEFTWSKHGSDVDGCPQCAYCYWCSEEAIVNASDLMQVTLAGMPNAACDGTYVLPLKKTAQTSASGPCIWGHNNIGAQFDDGVNPFACPCAVSSGFLHLEISNAIGVAFRITVTAILNDASGLLGYTWVEDYMSEQDCLSFLNESVTLSTANSSGSSCGAAGTPTCTITTP